MGKERVTLPDTNRASKTVEQAEAVIADLERQRIEIIHGVHDELEAEHSAAASVVQRAMAAERDIESALIRFREHHVSILGR